MACRCTVSIKPHSWVAERGGCETVETLLGGQMPGLASSLPSFLTAGPPSCREFNVPYTVYLPAGNGGSGPWQDCSPR